MKDYSGEHFKKEEISEDLEACQKTIGYYFKDVSLLRTALTHNSYANENNTESYQRLEFLGDSVVSLVVSTVIYNKFGKLPEGSLTKLRASLVCEKTLAELSVKCGFNKYLRLGVGETRQGGREKPSILADIFESVTGAIYTDGGFEAAGAFLEAHMTGLFDTFEKIYQKEDHKTNLQEYAAARRSEVRYEVIGKEGPDHDCIFTVEVTALGRSATGKGRSKKEAEQDAANNFLQNEGPKCL